MIHILKMRYFSPCKERFFSKEGNFGQRRQMEKKKKENWEEKEGKLRRKRRKHFHRRKRRARKRCNSNLVGHQRSNQNRKNAGSACIAMYAIFLVIALILTFLNKKYRVFMYCKKEYDVYYTFKTYFIHFKRPRALQQLLQNQSESFSSVVTFSFTYTCVIIICWPQNRMMYKRPWALQQLLQKQS